MIRRKTWGMVAAGLVLLLSACGGGGGTVPGDGMPAMQAHAEADPPVRAVKQQPRDTREVTGDGFTLHAPSVFQRRDTTDSPRAGLVLERPSSSGSLPARLVVVRDAHAKNDVVEQAYAAEVTMRTTKGVTDVLRSDVVWPGARRAVLLQWTQDVPVGEGTSGETASGRTTRARFWQLNTQGEGDLIYAVVAVAPVDDFEASGVGEVLRTFRMQG